MITQLDRIEEKLNRLLEIFDEGTEKIIIEDVVDIVDVVDVVDIVEDEEDEEESSLATTNANVSIKNNKNNHLPVDGVIVKNNKSNGKTLTIHATNDEEMKNIEKIINKYYNKDLSMVNMFYVKDKELLKLDWSNCPEYKICPELLVSPSFKFHYKDEAKFKLFIEELNGSKIKQNSIWFPERLSELSTLDKKKYINIKISNKYPIYVISKGRWEKRLTINWLERCDINYKVIIEPTEYDMYVKHLNEKHILVLPEEYANQGQGSIPARNYAMLHSTKELHSRCWILDDNINGYMLNNLSQRVPIESGIVFRFIEDYVDNYKNILVAGHEYTSNCNYDMKPPVIENRRVFSSILIDNKLPEILGTGWRGKYNEDVDICIRTLKAGYNTLLFNNILSNKNATGKDKGGNTDGIYLEDGNGSGVLKTQSLIDQHPNEVKSIFKYKRTHHSVKWDIWKNNILLRCDEPKQIVDFKLDIVNR